MIAMEAGIISSAVRNKRTQFTFDLPTFHVKWCMSEISGQSVHALGNVRIHTLPYIPFTHTAEYMDVIISNIRVNIYIMYFCSNLDCKQIVINLVLSPPRAWPRGYTTFFMLNSAEHQIYPAHNSFVGILVFMSIFIYI